jgi:hypothetical protein
MSFFYRRYKDEVYFALLYYTIININFFLSKRRAEETLCPNPNILNIKEKIVQ